VACHDIIPEFLRAAEVCQTIIAYSAEDWSDIALEIIIS
jgi:hypothetical protein